MKTLPTTPQPKQKVFTKKAATDEPLVMVTAYDYPSARLAEQAGVDVVLVGDTAAMTTLGYDNTASIRVSELLMLTAAVRRGLTKPMLLGDLPFGTYEQSDEQAVNTAMQFLNVGCDAVKLEGGGSSIARGRAISKANIPVVGHLGLTPQSVRDKNGYRAQARSAAQALALTADALALQAAGCCALVLEAIPAAVAKAITPLLEIPTIGIGAGSDTDGQVLVFHDLLGYKSSTDPRFVKRYANLDQAIITALSRYKEDVQARRFPAGEHTYSIEPQELELFYEGLQSFNPST